MASEAASPAVNYKVLVLKISIHCEGCKKKVTRILRKIQGVELMSIDGRQNLVTLKAAVDAQSLIQKLNKSGVKHAALFSEKNTSEEKEIIKEPSESKEQKQEPQIVAEKSSNSTKSSAVENQTEGVGKSAVESEQLADEGKGGTGNSKPLISDAAIADKKAPERAEEDTEKAVLKTSDASHQALPAQPAPYVVSYNVAAPSVSQSHYVQAREATAHMYALEQYGHPPPPPPPPGYYYGGYVDTSHSPSLTHHQAVDPYNNMFSDENPNACAIM